ncbi:hypothetical protein OAH23_07670 [Verrucomicrobia bacterium]|nr:hypothetical protein [Verrucomicrobiota bacterium]MDB4690280.1 hypothetical protein [Verrucomicrobiota bacterium]
MNHLTGGVLDGGIELFLSLLIWSVDARVYRINVFVSIHRVFFHVMLSAPLRRVSLVFFVRQRLTIPDPSFGDIRYSPEPK